jgi:hypothetical protein
LKIQWVLGPPAPLSSQCECIKRGGKNVSNNKKIIQVTSSAEADFVNNVHVDAETGRAYSIIYDRNFGVVGQSIEEEKG